MTHKLFIASALAAAALAGCGGGGGGAEGSVEAGLPAQALTSPEAFSSFVGSRRPDDSAEPLPLGSAVPPTSESAEPVDAG